jgi:hypothetical protein
LSISAARVRREQEEELRDVVVLARKHLPLGPASWNTRKIFLSSDAAVTAAHLVALGHVSCEEVQAVQHLGVLERPLAL